MSRSYRKPYLTDQQTNRTGRVPLAKRKANRAVRKAKDVADGKAYRKESNPWDIRDWSFYDPKNPKAHRK